MRRPGRARTRKKPGHMPRYISSVAGAVWRPCSTPCLGRNKSSDLYCHVAGSTSIKNHSRARSATALWNGVPGRSIRRFAPHPSGQSLARLFVVARTCCGFICVRIGDRKSRPARRELKHRGVPRSRLVKLQGTICGPTLRAKRCFAAIQRSSPVAQNDCAA